MDNSDELLQPAPKRRRIDETANDLREEEEEQQQDDTVIPDSDGEQEDELPLPEHKLHTTTNSDDGLPDESMLLHEADKSLPLVDEEDWDAVYDEVEWDGLLAVDDDIAAQQIFSPNQPPSQTAPLAHPSSSPLKASHTVAGPAVNVNIDARADLPEEAFQSQQHPMSSQGEEEEARIRAQEEAMLAKYRNLDYLSKFNAQHASSFDSPAPGSNAGFATAGFTSVRGKKLVPSEEAMARASRFAQFSPEAAKNGEGGPEAGPSSSAIQTNTETPTFQRSHSVRPLVVQALQSTIKESETILTVTHPTKPPEPKNNPLQPLRYGPKKGHALLPNRMPSLPPRSAHEQVEENVPLPAQPAAFSGFTSGSGSRVAMPTKEQAEQHVKGLEGGDTGSNMLEEVSGLPSSSPPPEGYAGLSFAGGGAFKMPSKALLDKEKNKMQVDATTVLESAPDAAMEGESIALSQAHATSGSTFANGKTVALPSDEKIAMAVNTLNNVSTAASSTQNPAVESGGFTTGSGKTVAMPSEEQIKAATLLLDDNDTAKMSATSTNSQAVRSSTPFAGLTSGGGKAIAEPSAEAMAASASRLNREATPAKDAGAKTVSTPARPVLASKATNILPRSNLRSSTPNAHTVARASSPAPALNKPFRVPVPSHLKATTPSTPAHPTNSQSGVSASQPRRLSLEMTPRNTPKSALNRSTFKTPFKNGMRPDPKTLEKLKEESNSRMVIPGGSVDVVPASQTAATQNKVAPGVAGKNEHRVVKNSVFDLYTKVPRKSMAEYGFDPYISVDHLIDCKVPTDVIFMTYHKAEVFKFRGEFGYEAAFEDLVYYCDCSNITMDWVKNHWTLIVWKTAAMVRAKPDELLNWWNFQRMVDQLKYRYEKEVVCGQRSCIKRIQERDSSAWLPMILVVVEIIFEEREIPPEPGSEEERQGIVRREMVAVAMVLSDGWYKIRTSGLDDALFRGIAFRSIYPGLKMRIQGAKLDGSSDGAEPLEAFNSSMLVISGNGTSRAAWHEKLGFQKKPYICAFSSLLPDGGLVPFIDVIVTKLYPLGYKGAYVEGESPDLWDEEEERARQRKWESDRENAMADIRLGQQTAYGRLAKLQCAITGVLRIPSNKNDSVKEEDPSLNDFSDVYDKLEEEPEKTSVIIRRLSKEVLGDLADFVRRKLEAFSTEGGQGLEKELEARCPPRVAKAFRIIRVKDARVHETDTFRDCQLNINDVLSLGPDFLVEGKRYLISNVNPGRPTSWSAPKAINGEIFLSTRFDSRWQVLPAIQ